MVQPFFCNRCHCSSTMDISVLMAVHKIQSDCRILSHGHITLQTQVGPFLFALASQLQVQFGLQTLSPGRERRVWSSRLHFVKPTHVPRNSVLLGRRRIGPVTYFAGFMKGRQRSATTAISKQRQKATQVQSTVAIMNSVTYQWYALPPVPGA